MTNKNLKVIKLGPGLEDREAYVIKHYIDLVYPCFDKFKSKVFNRFDDLPVSIKLYWIGKSCILLPPSPLQQCVTQQTTQFQYIL